MNLVKSIAAGAVAIALSVSAVAAGGKKADIVQTAVEAGSVNTEVSLVLSGGTEVTSMVTKEAVAELGLRPGVAVSAVIKATNVILGVPA